MPVSHALPFRTRSCGQVTPISAGEVPGLLSVLAGLPDPRDRRGIRHRLITILAVAVIGVLCGATNYRELGDEAADLPQDLLAMIKARRHPTSGNLYAPDAATLRRVLIRLDADRFDKVTGAWLKARDDLRRPAGVDVTVALDGKVLRGTDPTGVAQVKLLSAVTHGDGTVIAQVAVPADTTEVTQVAALLADVDLSGAVVTADAAHTNAATARHLVQDKHADYVLTVKANRPVLCRRICDLLGGGPIGESVEIDESRGLTTTRTIMVTDAGANIGFPHAAQVFQVCREVTNRIGERVSREVVLGVTSQRPTTAGPARIAMQIRGHWHVENKSHYVRDVIYAEDAHTGYLGNGPRVMATLRNIGISLLRQAGRHQIKRTVQQISRKPHRLLEIIPL